MKKNKKFQNAKFYCESCGAEVSQNARVCTNCGKFFSSVRCPNCGNTGRTEQFIHGCPECGYAVTPQNLNIKSSKSNIFVSNVFNLFSTKKNNRLNKNTNDTKLPIWIYIVCFIVLITVLICFYSCLNK